MNDKSNEKLIMIRNLFLGWLVAIVMFSAAGLLTGNAVWRNMALLIAVIGLPVLTLSTKRAVSSNK